MTGESTIWWRKEEQQQEALSDAFIDILKTTGDFCDDVISLAVAIFLCLCSDEWCSHWDISGQRRLCPWPP